MKKKNPEEFLALFKQKKSWRTANDIRLSFFPHELYDEDINNNTIFIFLKYC